MIAAGHSVREVMEYTPRQLNAFLFLAHQRRRDLLREQLHVNAVAARGDKDAMRDLLKELDS